MKRLFAAIFCLIFGLGLSGCSSSPAPDIHTYDLGGNEQIKLLKDTYAKKWVPLFVRAGFYREIYRGDKFMDTMSGGRSDCFGLINGNNDGGDLLTSLAEDPDSRIFAELKLYKSSYIDTLKQKVDAFSATTYKKDFFAFYVCNIKTGVDLVAGDVWDKSQFPYQVNAEGKVEVIPDFKKQQVMLLVNNDKVTELKDISLFTTAPDANEEVGPCDAQLQKDAIKWTCYAGQVDDGKGSVKGKYDYWMINLDGTVSKKVTEQSKF
jgi:hypothetical protein